MKSAVRSRLNNGTYGRDCRKATGWIYHDPDLLRSALSVFQNDLNCEIVFTLREPVAFDSGHPFADPAGFQGEPVAAIDLTSNLRDGRRSPGPHPKLIGARDDMSWPGREEDITRMGHHNHRTVIIDRALRDRQVFTVEVSEEVARRSPFGIAN
jgi:hypothetical protein